MSNKQTTLDATVDLTRQRQRQETDAAFELRRERELDDVAWLMSEDRGRRFMFRILELAMVYRSSFTGNSQTFFNEGRRIIGTTLLTDMTDAGLEELELKMKLEHRDAMRTEESTND